MLTVGGVVASGRVAARYSAQVEELSSALEHKKKKGQDI